MFYFGRKEPPSFQRWWGQDLPGPGSGEVKGEGGLRMLGGQFSSRYLLVWMSLPAPPMADPLGQSNRMAT